MSQKVFWFTQLERILGIIEAEMYVKVAKGDSKEDTRGHILYYCGLYGLCPRHLGVTLLRGDGTPLRWESL